MKDKFFDREIAIIDEHEILDEDGNVLLNLTPARLEQIAANNNKRIKETGDEVPLVIGHTKSGLDEESQPQIVGFAKNFKVKQLFATGRKAIFATATFLEKDKPLLAKFPRRSAELWLHKLVIDPISLLGASAPERNLGLLRFSQGGQVVSFLSPNEEPMDENKLKEIVKSVLEESDVFQWARSQMGDQEGEGEGEGDMGGGADMGEQPPMAGAQEPAGDMPPAAGQVGQEEEEEQPARMSASAASGTNTAIAGTDNDKVKFQMDKMTGEVVRLQASLTQEKANYKKAYDIAMDLRTQLQRARREKDLVQLDAMGYQMDISEELDEIQSMTDEAYQKRLNKIKTHYNRAPVGDSPVRLSADTARTSPSNREDQMWKVAEYAIAKDISYQDAIKQLQESTEKVY